jgi:hypothetical protein
MNGTNAEETIISCSFEKVPYMAKTFIFNKIIISDLPYYKLLNNITVANIKWLGSENFPPLFLVIIPMYFSIIITVLRRFSEQIFHISNIQIKLCNEIAC